MPGKGREIARRMALRLLCPQGIPEELVIGGHLVSRAVARAAREALIGIGHQRLFHFILRQHLKRRVVKALALIERSAVKGTGQHDDFFRRNAGRPLFRNDAAHIGLAKPVPSLFDAFARRDLPCTFAEDAGALQICAYVLALLKITLPEALGVPERGGLFLRRFPLFLTLPLVIFLFRKL